MSTNRKLQKKLQDERRRFKSFEGRKEWEVHIRLTADMLSDKTYASLSNDAKVLYAYMKLWAYKSKEYRDHSTFDYSISLAMSVCNISKKTAIKRLHELEEKGFIERQNNSFASRETSKWKFSDKWQQGTGGIV